MARTLLVPPFSRTRKPFFFRGRSDTPGRCQKTGYFSFFRTAEASPFFPRKRASPSSRTAITPPSPPCFLRDLVVLAFSLLLIAPLLFPNRRFFSPRAFCILGTMDPSRNFIFLASPGGGAVLLPAVLFPFTYGKLPFLATTVSEGEVFPLPFPTGRLVSSLLLLPSWGR